VGDKLYNLLDLAEDKNQSELLVASIQQRSEQMKPVPFSKAVDFKDSLHYAKFLLLPFLVFGLIWLSGNLSSFFGSANRVVNYDLAYEPPAPFGFKLLTDKLDVLDSETLTIQLTTVGEIRPVYINMNGKTSLLQQENGLFQYTFSPPLSQTDFHFTANDVRSQEYHLNALRTPSIQDFKVKLDYPNYTNRASEILKGTGNATIPEGTRVTWEVQGQHTNQIHLINKDSAIAFDIKSNLFALSKRTLTTS